MIPRILHYCWFGDTELPPSVHAARATWEEVMPEFKIVEWNEGNVDTSASAYTRWCAEHHKWSFLSDYVKADVLAQHGGIFLDADVVAHRSFASFLRHRAFSGFEALGFPFTAVWGSESEHPWPLAAREYMRQLSVECFGRESNTNWMTRLLADHFGIEPMVDTYQEGHEGLAIYPSETFCLGSHVGWATHMFAASWVPGALPGEWGVRLNDAREAAMRLEARGPGLVVRLARLLAFEDGGRAGAVVRGRGWTSARLPQKVGVGLATRTALEVGLYVARGYGRGLRRRLAVGEKIK
jgi:hypothetical protein